MNRLEYIPMMGGPTEINQIMAEPYNMSDQGFRMMHSKVGKMSTSTARKTKISLVADTVSVYMEAMKTLKGAEESLTDYAAANNDFDHERYRAGKSNYNGTPVYEYNEKLRLDHEMQGDAKDLALSSRDVADHFNSALTGMPKAE
jgi:hypothetical protein